MLIPFNIPPFIGSELENIKIAIENRKICGDGDFTKKCHQWLNAYTNTAGSLLTTSCTHALEMSALLANIAECDEVIMPSYTFVSTANAFVLRGAKIVFVDIRPDTMNINENLIEDAITHRTKAIVPVHYAGVACEMDIILDIAKQYNLLVIEDSAQGIGALYKGKPLGTLGDMGCYSFHETKNVSCGEGGALLIKSKDLMERAEIIREKGTNRNRFLRGQIDKYTWVDMGSSYLPSELNAAYLYSQLQNLENINSSRLSVWNLYYQSLLPLKEKGYIELPIIPENCMHNAHMFYIKVKNIEDRSRLIAFLKKQSIYSVFHYIPLHSSPAGLQYGRFNGKDIWTTKESERILRLPMHLEMNKEIVGCVSEAIKQFFNFK